MRFVPWWTAPPAIVAEALTAVSDPLATALCPGPPASGAAVAASLALSLMPAEDDSRAPAWLLDTQLSSFRRVVAALKRFRGTVLADAVGSGKTYIALAVASTLNHAQRTTCLVPATLLIQWEQIANDLGVPVELCSHEQASRGRLPDTKGQFVIVDESHHFRNRLTKRYLNVATWLVGRQALLVSATPIVNRYSDLGNQLLLCVRDDALIMDGIPSLRALFVSEQPHPALGHLVIENDSSAHSRPRRILTDSVPTAGECAAVERAAQLISGLGLSAQQAVAAMIRRVLLRAASSSPAALTASLRRYQRLLLHARDALQAGRPLNRSDLHRFTGELGDQLVWWELLAGEDGSCDLELADLAVLEEIIPVVAAGLGAEDEKLSRLREILLEEKPTLVFTVSRDTVRYIRRRLASLGVAWCTGSRAGIGSARLPRRAVLGWFQPTAQPDGGPRHLIVTDVAAEGLNLQRACQVVHYDLPWTPMRLQQREGRSIRLGSRHQEVAVMRFAPPPMVEDCLRLEHTLVRKARLPAKAGLGGEGRNIWRWRTEVALRLGNDAATAGVASVSSQNVGLLAGIALYRSSEPDTCLSAIIGWIDSQGVWTEKAETVEELLLTAGEQHELREVGRDELRAYRELLTPVIRQRLALTRGGRWLGPHATPASRAAAVRLGELIRHAARERQEARLSDLERGLAFVAGGHTAGEELLLEQLVDAPAGQLADAIKRAIPHPAWSGIEARLTGLIVFRREQ